MGDTVVYLTPRGNIIKEADTIWTVLVKENVVIRCNVESEKGEAVAAFRFVYNGINGKHGYWFTDKDKSKMFINLTAESNIRILDTNDFKWEIIRVNEEYVKYSREDLKFWTSFCYGGFYWKVGFSYPGIVKMSIETNEVTYIQGWLEELKGLCNSSDLNLFFGHGYCVRDNRLLLPVYCSPIILEMDMCTYECVFHKYPLKYKGFRVLSGDSDDIWAEMISGDLVRIDRCMHLSELKNNTGLSIINHVGEAFWKPTILDSKVLFLPHFHNRIFEADKDTMEVTQSKLNDMLPGLSEGKVSCIEAVRQGDTISFFYMEDDGYGTYCEYDTIKETVKTKSFLLEENEVQHTAWLLNLDQDILYEAMTFDLKSFVAATLNNVMM